MRRGFCNRYVFGELFRCTFLLIGGPKNWGGIIFPEYSRSQTLTFISEFKEPSVLGLEWWFKGSPIYSQFISLPFPSLHFTRFCRGFVKPRGEIKYLLHSGATQSSLDCGILQGNTHGTVSRKPENEEINWNSIDLEFDLKFNTHHLYFVLRCSPLSRALAVHWFPSHIFRFINSIYLVGLLNG